MPPEPVATIDIAGSPRRTPGELRHRLRLLLAAMALLLVGGGSAVLVHMHDTAFERAAVMTAGAARLLDDSLSRTLTSSDAIIARMADVAQDHMAGRISHAEMVRELVSLEAGLMQYSAMLVTDAKGDVIAAARPPKGGAPVNYSGRDYFGAHRDGAVRVIGPMVMGAYSQIPVFTVSRRVNAPDGGFAGVVVVGISAHFFTDFYNTLGLGPGSYIGANTSGRVMLRQPNPEDYVGRPILKNPIFEAAASQKVGTLRLNSPGDSVERVVSYRKLANFDVLVSAGISVEDIMAPWWHAAAILSGALAVVLLGLAGVSVTTFRALSREEAVMASL